MSHTSSIHLPSKSVREQRKRVSSKTSNVSAAARVSADGWYCITTGMPMESGRKSVDQNAEQIEEQGRNVCLHHA
jgi:hypothetical protein